MKLLYKDEPRTLVLSSETYSLTFRTNSKQTQLPKPTVNLDLVPNASISRDEDFRPLLRRDISGCLGLIYIEKQIYLAVITRATKKVASPIHGETVDKIDSVDFVSLNSNEWDFIEIDSLGYPILTADEADEEKYSNRVQHPCWEFKKLLSNGSFYYSNDFDLTSTLQSRGVEDTLDTISHYLPQYMWNSFLIDDMIQFRSNLDKHNQLILDDNRFLTSVIRGFAKSVPTREGDDRFTIISKQSWKRAGTRYNTRGIDDNGNVANFVETEFIYYNSLRSSVFTYTQIRGSVPTFWEQDSSLMNPKITLTRSAEATQPVFNKHFADLSESYGVCHIVDLLSKTKSAEIQLSNRYRQLLKNSDRKEEIDYTDFDFHQETKVGGFASAVKILRLLDESLHQFGFFSYDLDLNQEITRQDGVFRVNCLDCLDRTNLIEQVISRTVLDLILQSQSSSRANQVRAENLKLLHNALWADNGDAISQIYTGTNALKSSFSRSGKMNIAGALSDVTKSVSRMYQNTFVDGKKQSTIDLLLGVAGPNSRKVKIYDPASEFVSAGLKQQLHLFSTNENIKIFTGTYNVNALEPSSNVDLTAWLFPPENESLPDIYAIGFQELIELNAGAILNADASRPAKWAELLNAQLNSQHGSAHEKYVLLRTESIASMSIFLFVKQSAVHHVTKVSGSYKKTGLGGIAANKGACAVRFEYGATSFSLITSHLAAGTTAVMERFNDYSTIMNGLVFTRNYSIQDHDHVIWFGDLNYRLSLPNYQCRELVENGAFDELIQSDQLTEERRNRGAFQEFNEGLVKFYPTYKFDKGTSDYDTSEKQRTPSWTDRVLFISNKKKRNDLQQLNYNSVMDIFLSDHKPVYATFEAKVEFIDKEKKAEITKSLYDAYRKEHGSFADLVSLHTLSPTPSTSSRNEGFAQDALNDLNLLDDFDPNAPSLPSRPHPNSTAPKRVPPPPAARKVVPGETAKNGFGGLIGGANGLKKPNGLPHRLPPPPRSYSSTSIDSTAKPRLDSNVGISTANPNMATAKPNIKPRGLPPAPQSYSLLDENTVPTPPAPRSVTASPAPMKVPIGFSSSPLVPLSRTGSNASSLNQSPIASPAPSRSVKSPPMEHSKPPLVPTKPSALSASKIKTTPLNNEDEGEGEREREPEGEVERKVDIADNSNKVGNKDGLKKEAPVPPAARSMRAMSDWKPLVPK